MVSVINSDMVIEVEVHRFMVEASQLQLPVSKFPVSFETTLGNKQPLIRHRITPDSVSYHQVAGCIELEVLND